MALVLVETGSGVEDATVPPGGELRVTIFPGASHTLLVVGLFWFETTVGLGGVPIQSATYKGVAGVLEHSTSTGARRRQLWRFQGNFDAVSADAVFSNEASYDGAVCGAGVAAAFTGEDVVPVGNIQSSSGTGTSITKNVPGTTPTSQIWDLLGVDWTVTVPGSRIAGAGQTKKVDVAIQGSGDLTSWITASSSVEPGNGGIVTMSWTISSSKPWGHVAYEVFEAPGQVLMSVPVAVQASGPRGVSLGGPVTRALALQARGSEAIAVRQVSQVTASVRVASARADVKFGGPALRAQCLGPEVLDARVSDAEAAVHVKVLARAARLVKVVPVSVNVQSKGVVA